MPSPAPAAVDAMANEGRADALGLARGSVRVAPPNEAWAGRYAEMADTLVAAVGGACAAIEHIGSTAVPDLPAKPVIDIALLLRAGSDPRSVIAPLTRLGYEYRGDAGSEGGYVFVLLNDAHERVANLHVLAHGDRQWDAYRRFRAHLRDDASARAAYAKLKRELATRFPNDRAAYMAGKSHLIRELLDAAADLELTRAAIEANGPRVLVVDDLRLDDVPALGWSGGPTHLRAVERFLARAAAGQVDYLAVRGLNGKPVAKGAIDYAEEPGAGTIVQLTTHPQLRRLGLGSTLIAAAEARIRLRGLRIAKMGVEDDNPRARALYERLGYAAVRRSRARWQSDAPDGSTYLYETTLTQLAKMLVS